VINDNTDTAVDHSYRTKSWMVLNWWGQ